MFNYVLITAGKDKSRNKLVKIENINQHYSPDDEDVLVSLWQYGSDAVSYFQKNGTLTEYKGEMSINALPFDIDEHEGDISHRVHVASGKTKKLLSDLREKGITTYIISYSGSGGFHVMVPSDIFGGFSPSSVLPAQMLALAKSLTTADFDKSIYGRLRMFRLYGTKHPKTKLFKIQIEEELLDYPDKIIELAKSPRDRLGIKNQGKTKTLVVLKDRAFELVPDENIFDFDYKPKNKLCIAKLLQGIDSGGRNEALCRVTSHFKREGYSPELAFEFVLSWNKFNKPPEDLNVLKTTFKSIWENDFSYGCYDWLLDSYCDKDCYLYKNKQTRQEDRQDTGLVFYHLGDAQKAYEKFVKEERKINLGISKELDDRIRGMAPQQSAAALGRPTSFKSTVAMHIGHHFVSNYSGLFAYISLEMSLAMMYERQMQIVYGQDAKFVEANYPNLALNDNMKRFLIADKTSISVKDIEKGIIDLQEKKGEKVELIVVDFLHAIKGEGMDTRAKVERVVQELTDLPRKLDTRLLYLAHVHRTSGKDDSVYLPVKMGDGKDTSKIEDNAFFIFGTHLILDDPNCVVVQLLKNKHGEPYTSGVRLYKQNNSIQLREDVDLGNY